GTGISSGGALNSVDGANIVAGSISIAAGGATIASSSTTSGDGLTLTGGVNAGNNLVTFSGPGNTTVTTTAVSGGASGSLAYTGSGVLALNVANTYGGSTTASGGTLRVGASGAVPTSSLLTIKSPGQVDLNGQTS